MTARPWRMTSLAGGGILGSGGDSVVGVATSPQDAALICRAVNAHKELVDMVGILADVLHDLHAGVVREVPPPLRAEHWEATARALLARIKADSADLP
jgi:hypothetical protein